MSASGISQAICPPITPLNMRPMPLVPPNMLPSPPPAPPGPPVPPPNPPSPLDSLPVMRPSPL